MNRNHLTTFSSSFKTQNRAIAPLRAEPEWLVEKIMILDPDWRTLRRIAPLNLTR